MAMPPSAEAPALSDAAAAEAPALHLVQGGEAARRPPPPSVVAPGPRARALARECGLSPVISEALLRRGIDEPARVRRFLEPRLAELTRPDDMVDRAAAAERIARAVRGHERIAVYGDYDCDGIASTAILTEALRALGADVVPLLASRFDGGYGVSAAAARRIVGANASLLVTCDCGSSDHAVLAALAAQGLDVVVIDHHLVPGEPLPVTAFLNPHRPECGFAYKGLASCGLSLSILAGVRATLAAPLDLRPLLDLVAIGTIADVAPLDGDNRVLVRAGLERLRRPQRPGLLGLFELIKLGGYPVTAEDVAFRIAPRLNAPGRLGAPDLALELLLCRDLDRARELAAQVEQSSHERKEQQERMIEEALLDLDAAGARDDAALVVARPGWNHGIVGIVAGRLAAQLSRPVAVIGIDGQGLGRGSVRGPRGARLHDALSAVSGLLERFGGHQAAAGLEVRAERVDELRSAFSRACAALGGEPPDDPEPAILLEPEADPPRLITELDRLEPCGASNPAPELALEARVLSTREVRGGHLKLELELPSGHRLSGFGAGMGGEAIFVGREVIACGTLHRDRWRGGEAVELSVGRLLPRGSGAPTSGVP